MATEDPGFLNKQRELYQSTYSAHDIRREQWWLRILRAETDALFTKIDAEVDEEEVQDALFTKIDGEVDEEEVQAIADVASSVLVAQPKRFTPGRNDHEAGLSTSTRRTPARKSRRWDTNAATSSVPCGLCSTS